MAQRLFPPVRALISSSAVSAAAIANSCINGASSAIVAHAADTTATIAAVRRSAICLRSLGAVPPPEPAHELKAGVCNDSGNPQHGKRVHDGNT